ncbi:MAG TPA: hypothetical protein DCY06_09195, partial [Bacteroidetes bacterium]|nr:hypothetical protein [Bacteroidota bacterium]
MKSILIQILIFATNIIFNINIVHSRSAMNNDTLLLSSNTMNYEEAFIHIQNDSLFKHYINHYHLEKDNLITSDYYVWDNFLWNEIIDYKFPNINTAIKKSIYNLFTIVKSFYEPREIKDNPPLKDKEYSKNE